MPLLLISIDDDALSAVFKDVPTGDLLTATLTCKTLNALCVARKGRRKCEQVRTAFDRGAGA